MSRRQALIEACDNGKPEDVRRLLAAGADRNIDAPLCVRTLLVPRSLLTMLIYRRRLSGEGHGHLEAMRVLLEGGCDANRVSVIEVGGFMPPAKTYGETALNRAASMQDVPVVKLLLECGAHPAGVALFGTGDVPNELYCTALHRAAENNNAVIAQMLVDAGADVNVAGVGGITPLQIARGREYERVVAVLSGA